MVSNPFAVIPSFLSTGARDSVVDELMGEGKRLVGKLGNPKSPSQMTAGEINKALEKIDAADSKLTQEFIDAG
jgi:hypothetical protein